MCWHYLIACHPWSGSTCVMSSLSSTDRIFDMQMRCESVCSDGWLDCARAIWVGDAVYRTLHHCVRVVQSRWHFSLLSSACLLIRDYLCKVTHVSRQRSSDLRCIMIIVCRNLRHVSDAVILCILVDGHVWINSNLMAVKRDAWLFVTYGWTSWRVKIGSLYCLVGDILKSEQSSYLSVADISTHLFSVFLAVF